MKKLKFSLIEELELENCKRSLNFIKIMVFQKMLTLAMVYLCIASFFFQYTIIPIKSLSLN